MAAAWMGAGLHGGQAWGAIAALPLPPRPPTPACPAPQELHHRGVSEELATAAINLVFGEGLNLRQHLEQLEEEEVQGGLAAGEF